MTLFQLLNAEAKDERRTLVGAATLAGAANALILDSINAVARTPEQAGHRELFLFAMLAVLYVLCARYTSHRTTSLIEAILHRIKVRVGERIATAELDALERVKAAEICDRVTENTTFITERAGAIAALMQSSFIMLFTAIYIATLSLPAFTMVLVVCGAGAALVLALRREFVMNVRQTARSRVVFFERLTDLLSGFKEVKFSHKRSREVQDDIVNASDTLRTAGVKSSRLLSDGILLGESVLFALLMVVVYTLPLHISLDAETLARLVASVMFIWGPFMNVAMGLLPFMRANLALQEIDALEQKLEAAARKGAGPKVEAWQGSVRKLEAIDLEYKYAAEPGGETFRIGPINLTLSAGEVVFIVGGNGSGKSTLLKVLTGLYPLSAGELRADGITVATENVASFRDTISAIYSDFHLFEKLYGLGGVEDAEVRRLIARMRLDGQTSFEDRRFTRLTLSTGQKKRIAMIVALLEERPICVFDEWAADQDPEFRRYFYEELLPLLREAGKLVIVVSHDDRYFHCADRVVTMEYGRIRSMNVQARSGVLT